MCVTTRKVLKYIERVAVMKFEHSRGDSKREAVEEGVRGALNSTLRGAQAGVQTGRTLQK
ncbi:predicted protein [Botrytis cinerea T4]|uniref:Uncharacterized protein n=1 Tax=Botryotinia fuckeliana (strain T4) TaxID=999810 RepID=G2YSR8_BOTF4|nr:predicted protein [Botrytis cinerea T4]